jgi:hypothetical protein
VSIDMHLNSMGRPFHDGQLSNHILAHPMPWAAPPQQFSVAAPHEIDAYQPVRMTPLGQSMLAPD